MLLNGIQYVTNLSLFMEVKIKIRKNFKILIINLNYFKDMPAKATLFNGKCEAVYDFGTGPRNECFYNHTGNHILF